MDAIPICTGARSLQTSQTGNMLLFGVNAAGGDFAEAMNILAGDHIHGGDHSGDFIRSKIQDVHVHWRQIVLVGESCFYLLYAGSHSRRMTWPTC